MVVVFTRGGRVEEAVLSNSNEDGQMAEESKRIEELSGVGTNLAKKLREEGYTTIDILATTSPSELAAAVAIGERFAKQIIQDARKVLGFSPITAAEFFAIQEEKPRLMTGSNNLDDILGGGVPIGAITEFSGAYGSGKTQICFQLCVTVQFPPEQGGLGGKAYFIDTEGTFSPRRMISMAMAQGIDQKQALKNILVSKAYNVDHMILLVNEAKRLIPQENIKLLVIDSVASHFRAEFTGQKQLPARQQALMRYAENLLKFADTFEMVVVVTNQVLASPDALVSGSFVEPALGLAWGHRPTHRLFLRKARGNARIARIFDSPELPEREALFYITRNGIMDSVEE